MARKSIPSSNPIRKTRLENKRTLEEFAQECKVHIQAVYLNEMGMYPTILPSIAKRLVGHYGYDPESIEEEYQYYVFSKRSKFREQHAPYVFSEPDLSRCPLRSFRNGLGLNTIFGFANAIAVNPTVVRRVESCKVDVFPRELNRALRDIGLSTTDIDDLEYQHQEYFHSGLRLRLRNSHGNGRTGAREAS